MIIDILTLFPEMFTGPFSASIIKRALERGLIEINLVNIRDFSPNRHRTVDDTPFGGGGGMVMGPEAICAAVNHVKHRQATHGRPGRVVLMCPQGRRFTQEVAREFAAESALTLICGHYEGVDERVRDIAADDEVSLGDFVLTGGELPVMVLVDAVVRLLPQVLGEPGGAEDDSYACGLLEYPQFTRPQVYEGQAVPDVLRSGNHGAIAAWRRQESLLRTLVRRPDLLETAELGAADRAFLKQVREILAKVLSR